MTPKRRFWKDEQKMKWWFRRKHFSTVRGPNWVLTPLKSTRKSACHLLFILPKSSFGMGKLMTPKRRFWKDVLVDISGWWHNSKTMCMSNSQLRVTSWWTHDESLTICPSNSQLYAPQTKILEGRTSADKRVRLRFRSTFQRFVAQIKHSYPWKSGETTSVVWRA